MGAIRLWSRPRRAELQARPKRDGVPEADIRAVAMAAKAAVRETKYIDKVVGAKGRDS
jgi:hypothetical protein